MAPGSEPLVISRDTPKFEMESNRYKAIRSNKNSVKRFFIAYAALGASLVMQNSLSAQANSNAFYHCKNFDGLEMVDGKAFTMKFRRDSAPQKTYVGTYVILNERILNADYGGKGGRVVTKIYKV